MRILSFGNDVLILTVISSGSSIDNLAWVHQAIGVKSLLDGPKHGKLGTGSAVRQRLLLEQTNAMLSRN